MPVQEAVETSESQPMPTPDDEQVRNNDALDSGDMEMNEYGGADDGNAEGDDWDMLVDQSGGADDQNGNEQDDAVPDALQAEAPSTTSPPQQDSTNNLAGDTNDFDMVTDFDANMDTAGDALADYGVDDDLNLDDSAFGDAFHHNQQDMS